MYKEIRIVISALHYHYTTVTPSDAEPILGAHMVVSVVKEHTQNRTLVVLPFSVPILCFNILSDNTLAMISFALFTIGWIL